MVVMEGMVEKVAAARAKAKAKPELHVEVTNGSGSSMITVNREFARSGFLSEV